MISEILQHITDGVVVGSIVALAALGVTLVFGIARFANAAQGDMMTVGAYFALLVNVGLGLHLGLGTLLSIALTAAVTYAVYVLVFRPMQRQSPVTLLIASIGVALLLRAVVAIAWGSRFQGYDFPVFRAFNLGGVRFTWTDVLVCGTALLLMAALYLFLYRTRTGIEMRAVADSPDLARVIGVSSDRVVTWMWVVNAAVTAVAGVLLALKTTLSPNLGWNALISTFAAAILGGLGNPVGAVVGGMVIGVAEELSLLVVKSTYKTVVSFVILSAVLLWRPTGILGRRRA